MSTSKIKKIAAAALTAGSLIGGIAVTVTPAVTTTSAAAVPASFYHG